MNVQEIKEAHAFLAKFDTEPTQLDLVAGLCILDSLGEHLDRHVNIRGMTRETPEAKWLRHKVEAFRKELERQHETK